MRPLLTPLLLCFTLGLAAAADPDRNFSGDWVRDGQPNDILAVRQQGATIHCREAGADWSFHIDGAESKYRLHGSDRSSLAKWEGTALLINILVSGPPDYVIMDRWKLSRDRSVLTIERTIQRGISEKESVLVYRNGKPPAAAVVAAEFVVPAGTRIPLALLNSLSTRHTSEGDRVYLETVFPITRGGRIVIPKGSYVAGTVTEVKRAGRVRGKAELFLRFDSLTLPNGVTRDFRSRLGGADAAAGDLDRKEGKLYGEGHKAGDARTIATAAGVGAGVGGLAGGAAGHAGAGLGMGAAGGAAAGLAGVLLSRGPDLVLPKGTTLEMVLDRTLRFKSGELAPR
jgi:hypothetical protein